MTLINLGETPGDGTGDSRRYAGQKINALLPLIVKSVSVTTPPSSPQENDRYIIPANAAGDWANRENKIAAWQPVVWENDAWNHDGGWLYVTPEEGLPASDVNGSVLYKFLGGTWVVYDPQDAVTAAEAARDAAIAASENLAWGYTFDSGVTDSDPGTGKFRFDNATFMSATFLYISQTADEGDISSVIDSWDDSTSSNKATIKVRDPISPSNWLEAAVTGNSVDAGNYWKIPITPVAISGSIANGLSVLLGAVRHGDAGSGSVDSFNGRTGEIQPGSNDYTASQIGNNSSVGGDNVAEALDTIISSSVPIGAIIDFPVDAVPLGFLPALGATFDELVYPELYTYLGTNVLPNLTDRVRRAKGPLAGNVGDIQEDTVGPHKHYYTQDNSAGTSGSTQREVVKCGWTGITDETRDDAILNTGEGIGSETRVKSFISLPCIKAYSAFTSQGTADLAAMEQAINNAVLAGGAQVFGDDGAQVRANIGADVNLGELHIQHQKPSGTAGGTRYGSTSTWAQYPFNTEVSNTIAGASSLNGVITLPIGTYKVVETRVRGVNMAEARLKITHNTSVGSELVGETAYANGANGSSVALLSGKFTVTTAGELQIDYRPKGTTGGINDLGRPASSGDVEIYGNCILRKVA